MRKNKKPDQTNNYKVSIASSNSFNEYLTLAPTPSSNPKSWLKKPIIFLTLFTAQQMYGTEFKIFLETEELYIFILIMEMLFEQFFKNRQGEKLRKEQKNIFKKKFL